MTSRAIPPFWCPLPSAVNPTATPERLQVIARWNYWAFSFDDYLDAKLPEDFPVIMASVHRAMDIPNPPIEGNRRAAALQDVSNQLRQLGAPNEARRIVEHELAAGGGDGGPRITLSYLSLRSPFVNDALFRSGP